jgi:AraC-like DNA-binding protein
MDRGTVSAHFVAAAVARLDPPARDRVLRIAAIPGDVLGSPHARVTAGAFSALWLAVARELDDEFFGLDARRMKVGSFALLCHAVVHAETLERALKRLLAGFRVLLDDIEGELRIEGTHAVIAIANRVRPPADPRFAAEALLVMVHGLMCWLTGHRIPILGAEFAYPRPAHAKEYAVMFSEHLAFEAAGTCIRFDASLLGAPVVQNAATLRQFLRTAPQSVFLKYKNEDSWTAKLRRRLREGVGGNGWPLLNELAGEFHVTPTTLRRRLEAEGTSYQDLKDQLRRDVAIDRLCHSTMSVAEIAALVGFRETSAFHRAFKKWNGVQPGEYRLRQAKQPGRAETTAAPR